MSRYLSRAALDARRAALHAAAARRRLTPAEADERDNLDHRFYMRVWHEERRAEDRARRRRARA